MNAKGIIAIVGGVLLVVFVRWEVGQSEAIQKLEARAAQAALAQDTVEAARDTSRALPLMGVLGDSLRAAQRRAIQVDQRADQLDATLKLERVVRGRLDMQVALDTLGLDMRLSCGAAGTEEVRRASVTAVGPSWATVRLGRVEQAPSVCSAAEAGTESGRWTALRRFAGCFGSARRSGN
jgi:hypothetical protein